MTTIDPWRLKTALDAAEQAFWAEFAKHYPEVKSGDLNPLTAFILQECMQNTVEQWLRTNHPDFNLGETDEQEIR